MCRIRNFVKLKLRVCWRKKNRSLRIKRCSNQTNSEDRKGDHRKVVVILVNRKKYCVTSRATKDLLFYFVWVVNFKFFFEKSTLKSNLMNQLINHHPYRSTESSEMRQVRGNPRCRNPTCLRDLKPVVATKERTQLPGVLTRRGFYQHPLVTNLVSLTPGDTAILRTARLSLASRRNRCFCMRDRIWCLPE